MPGPSDPTPAAQKALQSVAVALADDDGGAPRILAKGRGALAEQILAIAFDRGIKVRSDADLAEVLSALELDSELPLQALAAVAEILSYVYRANGALPEEQGS